MRMFKVLVVIGFVLCATNAWATPSSEFVPDADTVALWHLNGNGDDASGNGNGLTVKTDRVSWVSGKFNQCAEMGNNPWSGSCWNSDGAALTAPGSGCTYPGSGDWTIEAWVLFPSNSGSYSAISHYSKHWAGHDPYRLNISNGEAEFLIEDSSNNYSYISADISGYVGEWVHLAGVYRYQQDVALYVNGVQVTYEATTLVIENLPSYDVFVGGSYCGISTDLKVDEVRISNVARYPEPALGVTVDIKPGSCQNPLRVNFIGSGVFPVAIVGSEDFDATTIDPDTVTLIGVAALRGREGDVSTAGDVCELGSDGISDLVLKFRRTEIIAALEDLYGIPEDVEEGEEEGDPVLTTLPNRAPLVLTLLGETYDGDAITGEDTLVILNRGSIQRSRR